MKKPLALLLALSLLFPLAACSSGEEPAVSPTAPGGAQEGAAPSASPEPQGWDGLGRPYRRSALPAYGDSTVSLFAWGEGYCQAVMYFAEDGRSMYELVENGEDVLYSPGAGVSVAAADGCAEGIWLLEYEGAEGGSVGRLRLIGASGETLRDVPLEPLGLAESYFSSLRCFEGGMCLQGAGEAAVLDGGGALVSRVSFDDPGAYVVSGGDGGLYAVASTYSGAEVSRFSGGNFEHALTLETPGVRVFGGNGEFPLICALDDGLYGLDSAGWTTPLLLWEECRLSVTGLRSLVPLSGDRLLLLDASGPALLEPASPGELSGRVTLTIASLSGGLYGLDQRFNDSGSGYYLQVLDYSDGGRLSPEDALTRLAADIAAGSAPDMFLLEGIPVNSWIRRGHLADLAPLLESGAGGLSLDDIAVASQLTVDGGLYFLGDSFGINSCAGLRSNFGDALGWTPQEYLEAEASLPSGSIMMYNMTRPLFFELVCSRYMQRAIDWAGGVCDFDNEEFISLLECACSIRETPESQMTGVYMSPSQALRKGLEYAVTLWIGNVSRIDEFEREVGERISLVGMPTPDGSCGSQLQLSRPVGVYAGSPHPEGCLEFLRFLLMSYDMDYGEGSNSAMPVYRPYLDAQIERALASTGESGAPRLTPEGAERLEELLAAVDCTTLCDSAALSIIEEEAAACFAGARSAEEAARIIQDRLSTYVAEQS